MRVLDSAEIERLLGKEPTRYRALLRWSTRSVGIPNA
jgi:hypothetical protein